MTPLYEPYDGDFDLEHGGELARLATDLLGSDFTDAIEIAVSLHVETALSLFGPEMGDKLPAVRIEVSLNEDSERWDYDKFLPIPKGWTFEQVAGVLADGYTVYFRPIESEAK